MIRQLFFGILLVLSIPFLVLGQESVPAKKQKKIPVISAEEQFLAGIVILHRSNLLSDPEKISYYFASLQEITGISAEKGREIIVGFGNNPKKWTETLGDIDEYLLALLRQKVDSLQHIQDLQDSIEGN